MGKGQKDIVLIQMNGIGVGGQNGWQCQWAKGPVSLLYNSYDYIFFVQTKKDPSVASRRSKPDAST